MTDVARIAAAVLRVETTPGGAGPSRGLPLGTPLSATVVVPAGAGRWMVDVAGHRLMAETAMTLVGGDQLEVVAARTGSVIELRVLQKAARFNETRYAAAMLAHAGAREGAATPLPSAARLLELVSAALRPPSATVSPDAVRLAAALSELTRPIASGSEPGATATALRRLVEDTGLLFDVRLRAALEAAGDGGPVPEALRRDARVLLGGLARALARNLDGQGQGAAPAGASATHGFDHTTLVALREMTEATLARQLDLASQWLQSGRFAVDVPLLLGDRAVVAELRIGADETAGPSPGTRAFAFDVRVELPDAGRIEAVVQWVGQEISARVFVDRPDLVPLTRTELAPLAEALRRAGFVRVSTDVLLDPIRLARPVDEPVASRRGGAIVDARA